MAEAAVSLIERILKDPDFDLLLNNAQRSLAQRQETAPTLEEKILADPDFDLLLNNAKKFKREREKVKPKRAKTRVALAAAAALTGVASMPSVANVLDLLNQPQKTEASSPKQPSPVLTGAPGQEIQEVVWQPPKVILKEEAPVKLSESKKGVDSNSPVHWDGDTVYVFTSTRDKVWRSWGPDLDHLTEKEPVSFDNKINGGRWIEATYKDSASGILYGWYHHEPLGIDEQFPKLKRGQPLTVPRIGAAISKNNGKTWHDLGFILDTEEPSIDSLDMESINLYFPGGNGDFSVIPDQDKNYFYFFFTNYHKDKNQQGITIARMKHEDLNNPLGSVWKWHDGKWQEKGEGGKVSLIFPAKGNVHKAEADFFWGPAVSYNTHLKTYVMFLNHSQDAAYTQEGVYVSFNPDVANPTLWSDPVKIYTPQTFTSWYPQIIGKRAGETDKLVGKNARLFVTGESNNEIIFLKPSEQSPQPAEVLKVTKKDIARETIIPMIQSHVLKMREERQMHDPEYLKRINPELNEDRINGVWLGGREKDTLTDTILVFSYHLPTNSLHLISIPRDLQSPEVLRKTRDVRNSRINQAFGKGGFPLIKQALENATGLSMDLTFRVNFDVLEDLIDKTVGYIDVELDRPIVDNTYPTADYGYKRIYYPAGPNRLNGEQALEVARSRHDYSDYDRSQRQMKIIRALLKRGKEEGKGVLEGIRLIQTVQAILREKSNQWTLQTDFDMEVLSLSNFVDLLKKTPSLLFNQAFGGGFSLFQEPEFFTLGISNRNMVVDAGVPDLSITKISDGNPYALDPRVSYWLKVRQATAKFLTENIGSSENLLEQVELTIPPRSERILTPPELTYPEVKEWIGKLRGTHDSVMSESLFTYEFARLPKEVRDKILTNLADAHARALIDHYGDNETIIGLDPGHGGSEIGSSAITPEGQTIREKDLTWELSQKIAQQIYLQTGGKYYIVFLRSNEPTDVDLDRDGTISAIERLQKRKAQLLDMESTIRADPQRRGKNVVYLSVHFNGSPNPDQKGTEVFWPNEVGEPNEEHRESSRRLAQLLQREILDAIRSAGYEAEDRGAKEDPDKRNPLANSETTTGPYIALGSTKLDRDLEH